MLEVDSKGGEIPEGREGVGGCSPPMDRGTVRPPGSASAMIAEVEDEEVGGWTVMRSRRELRVQPARALRVSGVEPSCRRASRLSPRRASRAAVMEGVAADLLQVLEAVEDIWLGDRERVCEEAF